MSKSRTITGFGPTKLTINSTVPTTSATDWIKFGPFGAGTLCGFANFTGSATSQSVRIDVAMTTESTAAMVYTAIPFGDLTSASGSSFGPKASTALTAGLSYGYIRIYSSELTVSTAGRRVDVFVIAGNPSS